MRPAPADAEDGDTTAVAVPRRRLRAQRCPTCRQVYSGEARFCPFDGEPLELAPDWNPSADPLVGQVLDGRYRIVKVLGEGGMGTVYEARHVTLDRRIAVKVLRRDVAQDRELCARFIQEAKAAAAIGHPNIVAVSDFGEVPVGDGGSAGRVPYFVMEFLTGCSLAARIAEAAVDPRRALGALEVGPIMVQAASALAAAHAAGIVHRDLKPDNVFLSGDRERPFVKLLDFGVAKIAGASRLTREGMVFGTPHYMSPEQASGEAVDHRTDIYALGVMMYECFAGRVPFEADTYMGVLTKHMFVAPEPIDRVVKDPGTLGELGPIVMRCLEKRAEDRYATMSDVASAIEAAIEGLRPSRSIPAPLRRSGAPLRLRDPEPVAVRAPSFTTPSVPVDRKAPLLVAAGLAVVVGGGIGLAMWTRAPNAPTTAAPTTTSATTAASSPSPASAQPPAQPAASSPAAASASASAAPAPPERRETTAARAKTAPEPPAEPASGGPAPTRAADAKAPPPPPAPPPRSGGDVVDPW